MEYAVEEYKEDMHALMVANRLNLLALAGWRLVAVVGIRHYFERKR